MSGILDIILDHKKQEVEAARIRTPLADLKQKALDREPGRGFSLRLKEPGRFGANIIAEIKRASPSAGSIRADLDAGAQAGAYERGGAEALSVLTDQRFFSGTPEDLQAARAACLLPVLRKDFIVSEYQVWESAAMGADAVLLIVRALDPGFLRHALSLCAEVGLDALVEVHGEEELQTALDAGAALLGVNNRDLSTFTTDLAVTERIAALVPPAVALVAESGVSERAHITRLLSAGVHNFLIGTALAGHPDPAAKLAELLGRAGQ
ncbi:MAG: indole-3-glycerol phosphate synthase TrpC [Deltaproteobacteria bacterium]|nr:indole-3-glycerol phosphate synthase TrpC [Deltaproteobacteria bacterium]